MFLFAFINLKLIFEELKCVLLGLAILCHIENRNGFHVSISLMWCLGYILHESRFNILLIIKHHYDDMYSLGAVKVIKKCHKLKHN